MAPTGAERLAVHCQHLVRMPSSDGVDPGTACGFPAREGRNCVGPFLHDLTTDCGFWEPNPNRHLIALPDPSRQMGRGRRALDGLRGW